MPSRKTFLGALMSLCGSLLAACTGRRNAGFRPGMMGGATMGAATTADMQMYMEMFEHHRELQRTVEELPNGIRTITESKNPRLVALLQSHVRAMYQHVADGQEVQCMSGSLPTMFRRAASYRRQLTLTRNGVEAIETADDPELIATIKRHGLEVTGFVTEGMPAMMRAMMR